MANIISIGTAVPGHCFDQQDILAFMQDAYMLEAPERRKLAFLYRQSAIGSRYSVVPDFGQPARKSVFFKQGGSRCIDERLKLFQQHALPLSLQAIERCIAGKIQPRAITHLITVSCTGMSAPGLDLQIAEAMQLSPNVFRTSVNFMGCYAAIHALKLADVLCKATPNANVMVVCTELCTIHFQENFTLDNASSSLLFGDGSAAVLVSGQGDAQSLELKNFYSEVCYEGKDDMSWQVSRKGFLMKLSAYIPQLIQQDISGLVSRAIGQAGISKEEVTHWCLHPGGKKIIEVIQQQLSLSDEDVSCSRKVLWEYGNMSSPSILFVLKEMMDNADLSPANVFGVAFGPGLTMETFIASRS